MKTEQIQQRCAQLGFMFRVSLKQYGSDGKKKTG